MNDKRDFDRAVDRWLDDGSDATPPEAIDAVLLAARNTPQERDLRIPWRNIAMTSYLRVAAVIALAAFASTAAIYTFGPGGSGFGRMGASPAPSPALIARGNGAIAVAQDGDILVADRPGGDLRPLVAGPEDDRSPLFSPDGTRLAFLRDTGQGSFLMVADADGTNVVQIPLGRMEAWGGLWSFAPDGRSLMTLAHIDGGWRVLVRPVDPAAALAVLDIRLPDADQDVEAPRFHPTNPQEILVVAQLVPDGPRGLYVYNLATGGIRTIVEPADEQYVRDVAWLPDGERITYSLRFDPYVVAADGSGDQAFDALRGRVSPLSNDGTRIVAERGGEGEAEPRMVIVPIDGDGEPVPLACGPGTDIECPGPPTDWIWSPDDSMLIATVYDETSSTGEGPLTESYLLVDAHTGEVTELDWRDAGTPTWQRVAP